MVAAGTRQVGRFSHSECRKNHGRQRKGIRVRTFLSFAPPAVRNLFRSLFVGCLEQKASGDCRSSKKAATFGRGHNGLRSRRRSREGEGVQSTGRRDEPGSTDWTIWTSLKEM